MLNPGPFCRMMEERKRSLIKWPSPTVDKTCREQTRICRLTRRKIFLKPIKYEQLVSHAKNKLHFFPLFLLVAVVCFLLQRALNGEIKAHPAAFWNGNVHKGTEIGMSADKQMSCRGEANIQRGRQKAYRVLVTACEALTRPHRVLTGSSVKGSDPVLASHLHLLIKCHNNMIFNFQRASPPLPDSSKRSARRS